MTGFASILKGAYVFATQGEDLNSAFQLAGVIVLDGDGGVTSGEQTHSDYLSSVSDQITGGSYFIGPDGRGTLTINTADQNIGQAGIENLSLIVLDNTRAFIQTFDDTSLPNSTLTHRTQFQETAVWRTKTASAPDLFQPIRSREV